MKTAYTLLLVTGLAVLAPVSAAPQEKKDPPKAPPAKEPAKTEPAKKPDDKPIVIPFELLKSRHMAIQVKINGKGPYRVIFDTGAPMNLVNNKTAKDSGLLDKKDKGGISLFGAAPAPKMIKKFEVGAVVLEDMPTMIMDHPTVAAIAEAVGPIEGLIGFPFFARYKMTIDYEKKEMTLVPNGYIPGDAMEGLQERLMKKMMAGGEKSEPTIVAPAGVWGFTVGKSKADETEGVVVTDVLEGGPAATGGLMIGDRLLTLDSRWTDSVGETFMAASLVKPGRTVTLVVKRDGKEVKLTVKPGKGV
jgi:hypothetical protein